MKILKKLQYVFLFIVLVIFFSSFQLIFSGTNDNFFGYGWGSSWVDSNGNNIQDTNEKHGGVGWISFNCVNESGTCALAENYGVNIDPISFNVSGYAWSHNYGWLKFGGLSGFPTGGGTVAQNAKFNGTVTSGVFNGTLSGWARFCSPTSNPDNCSGFFENDQNGGWDGWVSLSGTSPNYGVVINNNILSGYAWGGNDNNKNVVGWIDMAGVVIQDNTAVLDFYASPNPTSGPNFNTTLHWRSLDSDINFTSCIADSNPPLNLAVVPGWNGPVSTSSPSSLLVSVPYNITKFKLTCSDSLNNSYTSTITVSRNINESLTLRNSRVINGVTILSWSATNILGNSCIASTVNPSSGLNWTNIKTPPTLSDTAVTVAGSMTGVNVNAILPEKTTYKLTCIGKYSNQEISASLDLHTQSGASGFTSVPTYQEN